MFLLSAILPGLILGWGCSVHLGSFAVDNNNNEATGGGSGGGGPGNSLAFSSPFDIALAQLSNSNVSMLGRNFQIDAAGTVHAVWEEVPNANISATQLFVAHKASGGTWSTKLQISSASSTAPVQAQSERLSVDPAGNEWVVWQEGAGAPPALVRLWSNAFPALNTGTGAVVINDGLAATTPTIRSARDIGGNVEAHIVWNHADTPNATVQYKGVFNGNIDGTATTVSNTANQAFFASRTDPDGMDGLAVDVNNPADRTVHVAWIETPLGQPPRALHRRRTAGQSGTFAAIDDFSQFADTTHGAAGTCDSAPRVFIDPGDNVNAFWVSDLGTCGLASGRVATVRRNAFNVDVTPPAVAKDITGAIGVDTSRYILTTDPLRRVHIFYESLPGTGNSTVVHRMLASASDDKTTATSTTLDTSIAFGSLHRMDFAADAGSTLHFAWDQPAAATANPNVFYRNRNAGGTFSPDPTQTPTQITATTNASVLPRDNSTSTQFGSGLSVTAAGRVFFLFDTDTTGTGIDEVEAETRETSGSFVGPVNVSLVAGVNARSLALEVDPSGVAQVVWLQSYGSGNSFSLFWAQGQ